MDEKWVRHIYYNSCINNIIITELRLLKNSNVLIFMKTKTKKMSFRIERSGMKNPAFMRDLDSSLRSE